MNGLQVRLACAGLAFGVGAAPALADDHPAAKAAPAHPSMTMSHNAMTMHRSTTVHHTTDVNRNVDVHRNVTVNRDVNVHRDVVVNRSAHIHVIGAGGQWHPGARYAGPRVVFNDWGRYGLAAPAPGYGYYRANDGSLLLVLLATGVITEAYAVDAGY